MRVDPPSLEAAAQVQARPVQGQPHRARSPPISPLVYQVSYCFSLPPWFRGGALRGGCLRSRGLFLWAG